MIDVHRYSLLILSALVCVLHQILLTLWGPTDLWRQLLALVISHFLSVVVLHCPAHTNYLSFSHLLVLCLLMDVF